MMKKNLLIYVLFALALTTGCTKKADLLFPESADVRLGKAVQAYHSALMQAPGWKLFVYPQKLEAQGIEVGGLTYYVSFTDSNRVQMVSDFTVDMAATPKESGYRIKANQRPSLIFDTYSYIHVAADPDPEVSFSPTGEGGYGWGTDFDFSFTTAEPGDTLFLKGNFNSSDALLIPATQEEMAAAFSGRVADIVQATSDISSNNPFLFFPGTDNSKIGVSFNLFLYRINFTYLDNGSLVTITAPFSHTTYGIHLKNPVTIGGYTFQDLYYDDATGRYYIDANGKVFITNSNLPLFPFHNVIGKSITTITVPTTPLPGQSAEFADVYAQIKDNLINSPYTLELSDMDFIFDDESKLMALQVNVMQNGINFIAQYVFSYSINESNIATFRLIDENGNASLVENEMSPLLNYLVSDVFKLDYYTAVSPVLGQFTSQDHPGFFFTGNLQ
jgi:hypothetical protein